MALIQAQIKVNGKESLVLNIIFYLACAIAVVLVFLYFIFSFKIRLDAKSISELDKNISVLGSNQDKVYENKLLDYKKKIDDYSSVISNHKISSNVFAFIEQRTLPSVWFSSFDMSQYSNEIRLSGESESMETLGRQIRVFENSGEYITDIIVSSSELQNDGKVTFALSFHLKPSIFNYNNFPIP